MAKERPNFGMSVEKTIERNLATANQPPVEKKASTVAEKTPVTSSAPTKTTTINKKKPATEKKGPGRPAIKTEDSIKKTVYIPTSLMDEINAAPLKLREGGLSEYICELINKDLSLNKDVYDQLKMLRTR